MFLRYLFLLLLLGNVAFFVWINRFSTHDRTVFVAADPGVEKLLLLSELPAETKQWLQQSSSTESLLPNVTQICFSAGPFNSEAEVRPATELLNPLVLKSNVRKVTTTQEAGYWVYFPALSSRSEALKKGRELAMANVKDYYVVTAGNHENTISLGLYREQFNADNRITELATKGFAVKKEVRIEQWPEFWIDYSVTEEQLVSIPRMNLSNPDIHQNEVRCTE